MSDSATLPTTNIHDASHSTSAESTPTNRIVAQPMVNGNGTSHASHLDPKSCESQTSGSESLDGTNKSSSRVVQAEEAVDEFATKVKNAASYIGKSLVWANSRIKEAASDFWAEAQNIRSGNQK